MFIQCNKKQTSEVSALRLQGIIIYDISYIRCSQPQPYLTSYPPRVVHQPR